MADQLWPRDLVPNEVEWRLLDSTGVFSSPLSGTVRTVSRPGTNRWGARLIYRNLRDAQRYRLMALVAALRGQSGRIWIPDVSSKRRGSFPSGELLTNNTFQNGTTGWTASSNGALTSADRNLRLTISGNSGANPSLRQSATVLQYVPYAIRCMVSKIGIPVTAGLGAYGQSAWPSDLSALSTSTPGLTIASGVTSNTSATVFALDGDSTGIMAGHYFEVSYMSLTRCALADNGQNLLQRSDEFDNAYWTKNNVTVAANTDAAPDATTSSDRLVETSANGNHYVASSAVTVSSATADFSFSCALFVGNRSWAWLQLVEGTGNTIAIGFFNLSTGATGSSSVGTNWSNVRLSMISLGNGWYQCTVTARKTNAATSLTVNVGASTADGTTSYTGTNALVATVMWRATLAQSSVPTRLVQATSAAVPATAQSGGKLYVKGLPASTDGVAEVGDMMQVANELKRSTARLNSNGAGLGYLEIEPSMRIPAADNAPILFNEPMGKFLLNTDEAVWSTRPGRFSDFSLDFVEAVGN